MGLSFLNLLWATNTIKESIPTAESIAKAILDEQEMRKVEEEAYWSAWDIAYKQGALSDLRGNKANMLTWQKTPIYPHITPEKQADLIESGELKIIVLRAANIATALWADENREEAQNPAYQELLKAVSQDMKKGDYRIIG